VCRSRGISCNLCVHHGACLLLPPLPASSLCRSDASQKRFREAGIPWQGKALTDRARAASLAYARAYMSAVMQVSKLDVVTMVLLQGSASASVVCIAQICCTSQAAGCLFNLSCLLLLPSIRSSAQIVGYPIIIIIIIIITIIIIIILPDQAIASTPSAPRPPPPGAEATP
jgi:hypothetical protein